MSPYRWPTVREPRPLALSVGWRGWLRRALKLERIQTERFFFTLLAMLTVNVLVLCLAFAVFAVSAAHP